MVFDVRVAHEVAGVKVGTAEYEDGPTGCTAIVFESGAVAATDIRGGAPGVVGDGYGFLSALVFAGGSLLGLAAGAAPLTRSTLPVAGARRGPTSPRSAARS